MMLSSRLTVPLEGWEGPRDPREPEFQLRLQKNRGNMAPQEAATRGHNCSHQKCLNRKTKTPDRDLPECRKRQNDICWGRRCRQCA